MRYFISLWIKISRKVVEGDHSVSVRCLCLFNVFFHRIVLFSDVLGWLLCCLSALFLFLYVNLRGKVYPDIRPLILYILISVFVLTETQHMRKHCKQVLIPSSVQLKIKHNVVS